MKRNFGLLLFVSTMLMLFTACEEDELTPDINIIANAGPDQTVETGQEVLLDGTASVDESGEGVQIEWSFQSRPSGSDAVIQDAGSIIARFTPDLDGSYVVKLSINNNHGSSSDETTVIATASGGATGTIEISSNITDDLLMEMITPEGIADYIVTSNIDVRANLVIEPGVIVEFRSDAGMRVRQEGSIKAVGNQQDSIIFRGTVKVPGHWRGLRVDSNNPVNELAYIAIKHGGSDGVGGSVAERNRKANLIIQSDAVRLKAHNMLIAEGSEHGLYIHAINNPFVELSNNTYTRNSRPAYVDAAMFYLLDGESDYTGNDHDYIAASTDMTLSSPTAWPKLNVPLELPGVTVDSDLEIEPGAQFLVAGGKGIYVRSGGSIHAVGEDTDPIVLKGKIDVRGHWNGIRITSNNLNRLEYLEIHNGGQGGLGGSVAERNRSTSLMLDENARVVVSNVTISKSENYPFWIRGGGNMNIEFVSNTITDNKHAGWVDARYFHVLDGSSSFTGNDTERISSGADVTIAQDRTWKKIDVPYALPQVTFTEGILTIEAGASFQANNDGYLYVRGNGALKVLGTQNNPVEFTGQTQVRGAWRGMKIITNNPQNQLSHMIIKHGGQNGIGSSVAERNRVASLMLDENVRISIDNIAIHESLEYAFWIRHVNNLNIEFSNNTFTGNEKLAMVDARYFHVLDGNSSYSGNDDDIIRSEVNTTASGNIKWDRLDVPYELPDIVQVEGNLEIEAGARFEGNNDGGLDILSTGSIRAIGTPGDEIEFVGGINSPGHWRGINVRSADSGNEISHFVIRHTGSNGFGSSVSDRSRQQAIQVWGGFLKLTNGEITDGAGDGIKSHAGGVIERSGITYSSINGENEVGF